MATYKYKNKVFFFLIYALVMQPLNLNAIPNQPVLIKETAIKIIKFNEEYSAIGQCQAENSKTYYAKTNGTIDYMEMLQGQQVKNGNLLLAIDKRIAQSTMVKAESAFQSARLNYNRDLSLANKKIISQELLEKSKVQLEAARADLEAAIDKYDNMILNAPFDGYIGVIKKKLGDDVKTGDYLFTIIANGEKVIFIELPENLNGKINHESKIWLLDNTHSKVHGKLVAISNYLNDNGTITAKLAFPAEADLLHGSYVEVHLEFDYHNGLAVPEKSVLKNNQGNFIYKITEDNKAKQVYVTTKTRFDDLIEISSDEIKENDKVIIEGLTKVYEGAMLQISPEPLAATSIVNSVELCARREESAPIIIGERRTTTQIVQINWL